MPVYLIRAGLTGPVKIGKADDPSERMALFQIGHYEQLHLIRIWQGGLLEEAHLHLRFADLHIRGEWFAFSRLMLGDVGLAVCSTEAWAKPTIGDVVENQDRSTLRDLFKASGLKQRDVAQALGVCEATVSKWNSGQQSVPSKHVEQLATLTSIEPGHILAVLRRAAQPASAA